MADRKLTAHLFVCTHDRGDAPGARPSCARRGSAILRDAVKQACKGMEGVRINNSGCLDRCEKGISAVLYPEGRWFEGLGAGDERVLVGAVRDAADGHD